MPIEKQRYLYEILVRGTHDGQIAGAHQIHAERVVDTETGEVLADRAGVAEPLEVAEVGSVVGEAFTKSARQVFDLSGLIAVRDAALDEAGRRLSTAMAEVERLTRLLELSEASATALRDQLGAATAETTALAGHLAQATQVATEAQATAAALQHRLNLVESENAELRAKAAPSTDTPTATTP